MDSNLTPPIQGRKTRLVPFADHHLANPAYLAWLRDHEVVRTLNLPSYLIAPIPFAEVESYCRRLMSSETDRFFAIELDAGQDFIGTLKVGAINRYAGTADIGIMIGRRDLWGQGLAYDAISAVCNRLFRVEGFRRLTAGAMEINPRMIRVFEKLGFKREGCFRRQDRLGDDYFDHIHLGCLAPEFVG